MTSDSAGASGTDDPTPFRFAYRPGTIRHGDGCVDRLAAELAELDRESALVVAGRTVGTTAAVIDPVRAGLGDRLAGVFAETTPDKRFATAVAGLERYRETGADAVVGLGGGSSLDVARTVAVLAGSDREPEGLADAMARTGEVPVPADCPPLLVVPTTLAGADLSQGGGITAAPENGYVAEPTKGSLWDPALMPAGAFYDPALVATTPRPVLARSAMNGFDKGVEALYAADRSAITDATASRGLRRFAEGLAAFGAGGGDAVEDGKERSGNDGSSGTDDGRRAGIPALVEALPLVQYGTSRPDATLLGPIHAVAKQVARVAGCSQGVAHAVVAPHVLAAIFERVDGRRRLLADALAVGPDATDGSGDPEALAAAVVDRVAALRDGLGVPTRLREIEGIDRDDFEVVADRARAHPFAASGPADLDPAALDLAAVLSAAW